MRTHNLYKNANKLGIAYPDLSDPTIDNWQLTTASCTLGLAAAYTTTLSSSSLIPRHGGYWQGYRSRFHVIFGRKVLCGVSVCFPEDCIDNCTYNM